MIHTNGSVFSFWSYRATLLNNGEPQEIYCNNKQDIEDMVRQFPRMQDLRFYDVVPTVEQKARLEVLNSIQADNKEQWNTEVLLFVEHGAIPPETNSQFLLDIQQDYQQETQQYLADKFKKLVSDKNTEINEARLTANFTSFEHQGKQIACDTLSRSDIDATNGYVTLNGSLPPGWPGGWKAADNTYVAIPDVPAWKALYASMFASGNANFAHAQALKTLLAAATTTEEVSAIHWGMQV